MSNRIRTALENSVRTLLRPIASVLLKSGITWKAFSDLSKSVFVDVATEEFGINGRPTNVSRTSILTGISRKEIKRQRELLEAAAGEQTTRTTDGTRLLSGWHQDTDYIDDQQRPLPLPLEGPAPSFQTLFRQYGGDTPQQTLIKELINAGSARYDDDGRLEALRRFHMPTTMDEGAIRMFGINLYDHARTLNNNITDEETRNWFEGFAVDDQIDPAAVDAFHAFLDERGQAYLEEIDAWLNEHRINDSKNDESVRLGIGIYAIKGELPKGTKS